MGVGKYDIKEIAFDRTKAAQYELSILLGMDSFTYVVKEMRTHQLLVFRALSMTALNLNDWVPQFQRTVQNDELLRPNHIRKIYLSYHTERVTLVPERLFTPGKEMDYLGALADIDLTDACLSEAIPNLEAQLVYAIGEERLEATTRRFSPIRTRHVAAGLLKMWTKQSAQLGHRAIYCCLRDKKLVFAGISSEKIQFFNTFSYETAQDALYYVHLTYQQCGWSPTRIPLYLCGEVVTDSEVYRQLYRFVEDIRFLTFAGPLVIGPQLKTLPQHIYYDLLCQF
ncbi:MAG: DUF3822 family protein [Bacteroidota bacterium]